MGFKGQTRLVLVILDKEIINHEGHKEHEVKD